MSAEKDEWKTKESEEEGEEEPPSLTTMVQRVSDFSGNRKRSSVKFAGELNDLDLENKYKELIKDTLENSPPFVDFDSLVEPDLVDATVLTEEEEPLQIKQKENQTGTSPQSPPTVVAESRPQRKSIAEQIENKEITAEDIFNEIKEARAAIQDQVVTPAPAQTLYSYIISKSYSSENVVVLLNLRRIKDGEWILDRTIAQGMRSETYGGVVSIDQYGFSEPAVNISRTPSGIREIEHDRELAEILKRIEQYIAVVNKKMDDINISKGAICPEGPASSYPTCDASITYEDLSVMDKCLRMLYALAPEDSDPCSICNGSEVDTSAAIDQWIQNIVANIREFSIFQEETCSRGPSMSSQILTSSMTVLEQAEAQRSVLISQSKALLEQVQSYKTALFSQSVALLDQSENSTTLLASAKASEQPGGESILDISGHQSVKFQDNKEEKDEYQINIESGIDVDEFVLQHQN